MNEALHVDIVVVVVEMIVLRDGCSCASRCMIADRRAAKAFASNHTSFSPRIAVIIQLPQLVKPQLEYHH